MTLRELCFTLRLSAPLPYPAGLLYILFLFASFYSFPQSRYTYYGTSQGLSQLNVRTIIQDKEGFLWAGTWDGLNRFHGYHFQIYQHDLTDTSTISNNNIMGLSTDRNDRLWVLFPTGQVNIYDKSSRLFTTLKKANGSPLFATTYHPPLSDDLGFMWTALHDTLYKINPDDFSYQPFSSNRLKPPPKDKTPAMVLAEEQSIHLFYNGSEIITRSTDFVFNTCFTTSDKRVLFGTPRGELYEYIPQRDTFILLYKFITSSGAFKTIYTLFQDSEKKLWVATSQGVYLCKNLSGGAEHLLFEQFPHTSDKSKSDEVVYSIFSDHSDVLWVGTATGLYKINPIRKKFQFYPTGKDYFDLFGNSFPVALLQLSNKELLVGTTNGLYQYNPASDDVYKYTKSNSGYSEQPVHQIHKTPDGSIWFATRNGLSKLERTSNKFNNYRFKAAGHSDSDINRLYTVTSTSDGRIWAGCIGGLIEFYPESEDFRIHKFPSNIVSESSSFILSLLYIGTSLWAGTNGEGLLKINLNDMSYIRYASKPGDPHSLSGNKIMAIHRDSKERLWIATMGGGVNLLDSTETRFRHFTSKEGLSNNTVYGILEDNHGDIWVSTNAGLNRINGTDFSISVFGSDDLPYITEFNQNSYYKAPDGKLFFGGMRGFVSFLAEDISANPHPPKIALTDFLLFNKSRPDLRSAPEIRLRYNENFFSFELAALLYDNPGSNQYAYRLEGLHDEWIYTGSRRMVDFSYIEPGEYTFLAKAANEDGLWSSEQVLARIVIVPPFWRTNWFYSLIMLLLIATVVLSVRLYIRKKYKERIALLEKEKLILEERNKTRDRIARDLHDDLASTVSSAGLYLQSAQQMLTNNQEAAKQYLQKSSVILNKAEQSMSDIVWSVSPNYDTLDNLILRIRLIAQELCEAANILLHFISYGEGSSSVSEELRRNIYLAAKESVVNATRHAMCTELTITALISSENIDITISDNGKGFPVSENHSTLGGNGIKNITKRMEEIGGVAEIQSHPGNGTTINLSAPLINRVK